MGMKRANGTGSVYKLKQKLRKPFKAVITVGWKDDGTRIRKCIGYFEKSAEAYQALAAYQLEPERFDNRDVTFAQAWDWMITDKKRKGVDLKKGGYATAKKKCAPIWSMPIQQIRLAHLQAIFDSFKNLGRGSHGKVLTAINGAFKAAIKNDVIQKNYAELITLPPAVKSTLHVPFSEQEIEVLWQHADIRLVRVMLIYIYTGMRPAELYQVKIDNVHIKERYVIGGIKTEAGRDRIIPLAKCIMPFVTEMYSQARFCQSPTWMPPKYIQVRLDRPLKQLCKKLGIREHLRHDTRHTFISMARNYGMDLFTLKLIVGHAQRDVTSDVYTHKDARQLVDAVDKLPVKFDAQHRATM